MVGDVFMVRPVCRCPTCAASWAMPNAWDCVRRLVTGRLIVCRRDLLSLSGRSE